MRTADLVATVKARHGFTSDAALARRLELTEQTVARWRTGRNWPDDATAARLAELAELDPDAVVALVHADRSREPAERARWQRIAARLSSAATAAVCAILALWIGGGPDGGASLVQALAAPLWIAGLTAYTLATMARGLLGGGHVAPAA